MYLEGKNNSQQFFYFNVNVNIAKKQIKYHITKKISMI